MELSALPLVAMEVTSEAERSPVVAVGDVAEVIARDDDGLTEVCADVPIDVP